MSKALDQAFERLLRRFPPKHTERPYEKRQRVNASPSVQTNGWQKPSGGEVDWKKQDHIPVGQLDTSLWAAPPARGGHVSGGKGRGNKGPKNSG